MWPDRKTGQGKVAGLCKASPQVEDNTDKKSIKICSEWDELFLKCVWMGGNSISSWYTPTQKCTSERICTTKLSIAQVKFLLAFRGLGLIGAISRPKVFTFALSLPPLLSLPLPPPVAHFSLVPYDFCPLPSLKSSRFPHCAPHPIS